MLLPCIPMIDRESTTAARAATPQLLILDTRRQHATVGLQVCVCGGGGGVGVGVKRCTGREINIMSTQGHYLVGFFFWLILLKSLIKYCC